jgi:hypothetical protein
MWTMLVTRGSHVKKRHDCADFGTLQLAGTHPELEFAAKLRTVNTGAVIGPTDGGAVQPSETLLTRTAYRGVSRHRRRSWQQSIRFRYACAVQAPDADGSAACA